MVGVVCLIPQGDYANGRFRAQSPFKERARPAGVRPHRNNVHLGQRKSIRAAPTPEGQCRLVRPVAINGIEQYELNPFIGHAQLYQSVDHISSGKLSRFVSTSAPIKASQDNYFVILIGM